ncbi:exonuclease [Chitinophaga sp. Hz27]|uniref:exonuclease n=1 Tax=Chitinophaga sp. Hz27 TaxID=3347169 RepID=UPI0035DF3013
MPYIMVDIEADGPIPGDFSMISFGAVVVDESLSETFYGQLKPISQNYIPEALAVSGFTREETLAFEEPSTVMHNFCAWLKLQARKGQPRFISDNNGFDWMFMCWYLHHFTNSNPFGHSSQNLGSLYKGLVNDSSKNFKHLRIRKHTHNPVDDAIGNAEALLTMKKELNFNIKL